MNDMYAAFQKTVLDYYKLHARTLPWRINTSPYSIFVSEFMLQQTQVPRVIEKYNQWMHIFPTIDDLANAEFTTILTYWQGLGYNRRALYIHKAAQYFQDKHHSQIPSTYEELLPTPGVGNATANAILAYAYNLPVVYIETNIRTVYIHHFFENRSDVSDKELLPFIENALFTENPRQWYWALMDYGTHLKKEVGNISMRSKHYKKQSAFKGSLRQLRGQILKQILIEGSIPYPTSSREQQAAEGLLKEKMIISKNCRLYPGDNSPL